VHCAWRLMAIGTPRAHARAHSAHTQYTQHAQHTQHAQRTQHAQHVQHTQHAQHTQHTPRDQACQYAQAAFCLEEVLTMAPLAPQVRACARARALHAARRSRARSQLPHVVAREHAWLPATRPRASTLPPACTCVSTTHTTSTQAHTRARTTGAHQVCGCAGHPGQPCTAAGGACVLRPGAAGACCWGLV
jgi:hypothetical protein